MKSYLRKGAVAFVAAALSTAPVFSSGKLTAEKNVASQVSGSLLTTKAKTDRTKGSQIDRRVKHLPGSAIRIDNPGRKVTEFGKIKKMKKLPLKMAAIPDVELRGMMFYNSSWEYGNEEYGIYTFPISENDDFSKIAPFEKYYNVGYDDGQGTFYGLNVVSWMGIINDYTLDEISTDTWEIVNSRVVDETLDAFDVAVDPTDGSVYGCFFDEYGDPVWARADFANNTRTDISTLSDFLFGVGADKYGQYYGVGETGIFYKIDKHTGTLERIGETGIPIHYKTGGCFCDETGTFLMAYNGGGDSGVAEIDVENGETINIFSFKDDVEMTCVYVPAKTEAGAPAAPGLEVVCIDGSLNADITLTMPTTCFDGTQLPSEPLEYKVFSNSEIILEGTALPGEVIKKEIEFRESALYTISAFVINDEGESPNANVKCYMGKDAPSSPRNVLFSYDNGIAKISWEAVTDAANGGFIVPEDITYDVFDLNGEEVASNLTATEISFPLEEPTEGYMLWHYYISATYDGKKSPLAASNSLGLGAYNAPFEEGFLKDDPLSEYVIVDSNKDGNTWYYSWDVIYDNYPYESADDWVISPAILLEGGKTYEFSARVLSDTDDPANIEIFMGNAPDVESMTQTVIPLREFDESGSYNLRAVITANETKKYYIGFHTLSEYLFSSISIRDYSIGEGLEPGAPAQVQNFAIIPDETCELKATLTFTAPSLAIDGTPLTSDVNISIFRDDELIDEISAAPGESVAYEDNTIHYDYEYVYKVTPYNQHGKGLSSEGSSFVGAKAPAPLTNVVLTKIDTWTYELSWNPVKVDEDGNLLLESNVSYNVYNAHVNAYGNLVVYDEDKINEAPVTDTKFTLNLTPIDGQEFRYFAVEAVNHGVGGEKYVVYTLVGNPYELPLRFSGVAAANNYVISTGGNGTMEFGNSSLWVRAQDDDNSYFMISNYYTGDKTFIETGNILISGDNPVISYYIYPIVGESESEIDENISEVSVIVDDEEIVLSSEKNSDYEVGKWNKIMVPLKEYSGEVVRLRISAICAYFTFSFIDNIRVYNCYSDDLEADITSPASVASGKPFDISVEVNNIGTENCGEFTVALYCNGEEMATENCPGLKTDKSKQIKFTQSLTAAHGESATFKAVVRYADDKNLENNETREVVVERKQSELPVVSGLTGEISDDGTVSLQWDAMDVANIVSDMRTDDIESGGAFAMEYGDWTFVDVDNIPSGGFANFEIPGMTGGQTKTSFFVFDSTDPVLTAYGNVADFAANSGTQFLASLFRYDDGAIDDWAISPLLPGIRQEISFYAKSFSYSYPEKIEVWYTDKDSKNPSDYTLATDFDKAGVPNDWTQYFVSLPEGTKHFAIRSCAVGAFMLMIDDISYIPGLNLELTGYNVYCNSRLLNESPILENAYSYTVDYAGSYAYNVTAVYDKGESEFSETLVMKPTGVDRLRYDSIRIYVDGNIIKIENAGGNPISVSSADGKLIASRSGADKVEISVESGIYIVKAGKKTLKVIVK